ncbi:hypothetical protein [Bacillus smithii]|uniref:hypothetical protein n=1 Tax=Bacillus smithii TaxID=1479 RepID=UPI0030C9FC9C
MSSHWPDQARKQLEKSFHDGKPFQVAIVGSKALGKEDNGWSVQLKKTPEVAYRLVLKVSIGERRWDITRLSSKWGDRENCRFKPDMILLETYIFLTTTTYL